MDQSASARANRFREIFQKAFSDSTIDESAIDVYRHVHKTANMLNAANDEYLKPYNLTSAKFRMLMWLVACDKTGYEEGLLPSQLSRFQGVSPNTISSLLVGLEEQGWIQRVRHPTDHRKQIINITDAGRQLLADVGAPYHRFIQATVANLSSEEQQTLVALLQKVVASIQSAVDEVAEKAPGEPGSP